MQAYLVIREGTKWTDVFRLIPGQTVTIGRAPTNQIVISDDRCSRTHAEVFMSEGKWVIRDLDSRNGTAVGGKLIKEDTPLEAEDTIRIGRSQLAYVHDLSKAFSDSSLIVPAEHKKGRPDTVNEEDDSSAVTFNEPATITHRRQKTRFFEPRRDDESGISQLGRASNKLCRLAFELAKAPSVVSLAEMSLAGLFESVDADSGAVLLLPREKDTPLEADELMVVASRSEGESQYHRVSPFLADTVLREGEAVLARNVGDDSNLAMRDSEGQIHAASVICAPVRQGDTVFGLVHLYTTDTATSLDPDHLEFTLAVADTLAVALANLSRREELSENLDRVKHENLELRERLGVQSEIVGSSEVVAEITQQIGRAAQSRATVLIHGESGVGKELVARAIHASSDRAEEPFVCLNCAALSETLLESELFGHEKGAFTGATERKIGKFEAADGGTIFLDEIGEMTPGLQAKFLRVLEGHPFERVGGNQPIKVDVRVVAATNRDLEKDVTEGRFRRDLFFRLRVLDIIVPPLRKRISDIPDLAEFFLKKFNAETGRKIKGFAPDAVDLMLRYRWPGNVRELRNVIERAVVLTHGHYIEAEDLMLSKLPTAGDTGDTGFPPGRYKPLSLEDVEKRHILATLNATGWNKSKTAGILGIERSTLDRKIKRYDLADERSSVGK